MTTQCMQTRLSPRGQLVAGSGTGHSRAVSLLRGLYAAASAEISRLTAGFVRAQRRRAALRELASLSDRQLADIGVERFQIAEVVDGLTGAGRRSDGGAP